MLEPKEETLSAYYLPQWMLLNMEQGGGLYQTSV